MSKKTNFMPQKKAVNQTDGLQNIFYAGKMIGDYDMILYLNARNPDELNSSIELFRSKIEKYIVHYDLLVQDKVLFWKQFNSGIYEDLIDGKKE